MTVNKIIGVSASAISKVSGVALSGISKILGETYSGGGFVPTDITGCLSWFDAGDLSATLIDGDYVATWTDKGSNGYNATQSGADTAKPVYKTGILNGEPIVRFATGDWMQHTSFDPGATSTYFIVINKATIGNFAILASSGGTYPYLQYNDTWYCYGQTGSVPMTLGQYYIKCGQNGATQTKRYTDGGAPVTSADAGVGQAFLYIGTYNGIGQFQGDIAEIIIYDSELSTTDMDTVNDYLSAKYGISVTATS